MKNATELTKAYFVDLNWAAVDVQSQMALLFASLPEKGLKLSREKLAVDVMVIDSAEKPKDLQ